MKSEKCVRIENVRLRCHGMQADCRASRLVALCRLFLFCFLGCCSALANGSGWGQGATLTPGWERIGQAAKNAALATGTWAPAAGALVLQIGNADRHVQEWAFRHKPVFGSEQNADRASDNLKRASGVLWLATAIATPSADEEGEWFRNKAQGIGVQAGAGVLLRGTVGVLKETTKRERPNGLGKSSFPSGHASNTSLYNTMTSKNVDTLGWSDSTVSATRFGLGALTGATAWARVEANQHYPSDVLAGIALGHFFGVFFTEAFLGIEDPDRALVQFEPLRDGHMMIVRFGL